MFHNILVQRLKINHAVYRSKFSGKQILLDSEKQCSHKLNRKSKAQKKLNRIPHCLGTSALYWHSFMCTLILSWIVPLHATHLYFFPAAPIHKNDCYPINILTLHSEKLAGMVIWSKKCDSTYKVKYCVLDEWSHGSSVTGILTFYKRKMNWLSMHIKKKHVITFWLLWDLNSSSMVYTEIVNPHTVSVYVL